ncbi:putative protein kinase RLK-Pelle-LRR-IX family [Helianthus debilis subsp. tardiflorus]
MRTHVGLKLNSLHTILIIILSSLLIHAHSQTDAEVMFSLKKALNPPNLDWSDPDPCKWAHVVCSDDNRVTRIQIGHQNLQGTLPPTFSNLTQLERLELQWNNISGPLPGLNGLASLQVLMISNNMFTSIPNDFFTGMSSLQSLELDNNPFAKWKMGLSGTISPAFSELKSLQRIVLANNNLTGTIPESLATLPALSELDLENNNLYGKVPVFKSNLKVNTSGNPDIGKDRSSSSDPHSQNPSGSPNADGVSLHPKKSSKSWIGVVLFSILGGVLVMVFIGGLAFCFYKKKQQKSSRGQSPHAIVIHPCNSGSDNESVKITVAGSSVSVGGLTETHTVPANDGSDIQMVEAGNMVISIQVLKTVTNNFAEENTLGQGGFGTVYKGELHDGTKIAVKRMECGVITGKGLAEFQSEIAVLTKVRHRNLVALLGYCLDGNEKLLVYEYMPQGTLSRHLFNWPEEGLNPLEWTRRLAIALDVARGVEYLHGLAQQSFIHRDLKPSNILLGDDMRAKVGDFGLVRLAPEGKGSVETRIAGTFGYLAPEYAITGRVTTKVDVFSFGVILMELITGRKALDESQPEESMHLVTWFRRIHLNKDTFRKSIDQTLDLTEENLASISKAAELAGHCCAREPYQRPDMSHAVNVLSSLVEMWKPSDQSSDDIYGIDLDLSLPQALQKWQAFEGGSHTMDASSSSFVPSLDNTQTSIPTRPYGFAESFTSMDGR